MQKLNKFEAEIIFSMHVIVAQKLKFVSILVSTVVAAGSILAFSFFPHQSLDLCQCCANLGVPVVAANGWAAMKAIVLRNLSARRAARRRVEIFVWTVDDERQGGMTVV